MEFPIDPALLEEEGIADAEGEIDDAYMVEAVSLVNIYLVASSDMVDAICRPTTTTSWVASS